MVTASKARRQHGGSRRDASLFCDKMTQASPLREEPMPRTGLTPRNHGTAAACGGTHATPLSLP